MISQIIDHRLQEKWFTKTLQRYYNILHCFACNNVNTKMSFMNLFSKNMGKALITEYFVRYTILNIST